MRPCEVVSLRRYCFLGLSLVLACARPQSVASAQDLTVFPRPNRPVSRIVSSSWDSEAARDRNGEADRVFEWLGLRMGDRAADIGAVSGYYTVRLARRLGPAGVIYAQDVNPDYLTNLRLRLEREGFPFVLLIQGDPADPKLPPGSVDVAILSHMYHEIENPYEFFYRLHSALAPGARVGIIDLERPTDRHGTPATLLRCELGALGYRETQFTPLTPAQGYLAIYSPPDRLPAVSEIRVCDETE